MCSPCSAPTRPFAGPSRLLAGKGSSAGCATELRALGLSPAHGVVLLVVDDVVMELGLHRPAWSSLRGAGFTVLIGPGVAAEPRPETVRALMPDSVDEIAAVVAVG